MCLSLTQPFYCSYMAEHSWHITCPPTSQNSRAGYASVQHLNATWLKTADYSTCFMSFFFFLIFLNASWLQLFFPLLFSVLSLYVYTCICIKLDNWFLQTVSVIHKIEIKQAFMQLSLQEQITSWLHEAPKVTTSHWAMLWGIKQNNKFSNKCFGEKFWRHWSSGKEIFPHLLLL